MIPKFNKVETQIKIVPHDWRAQTIKIGVEFYFFVRKKNSIN